MDLSIIVNAVCFLLRNRLQCIFTRKKTTKSRELYQHYLYLTSRVASYNKKNGVLSANMVNPNGICTGIIKYLWDTMNVLHWRLFWLCICQYNRNLEIYMRVSLWIVFKYSYPNVKVGYLEYFLFCYFLFLFLKQCWPS